MSLLGAFRGHPSTLQGCSNARRATFTSSRTVHCHAGEQRLMGRRGLLSVGLVTSLVWVPASQSIPADAGIDVEERQGEVRHSKEDWKQILGNDSNYVLRDAGTERPFSSPLNNEKRKGTFTCKGCSSPVFASEAKYNSGTGWPSFFQAIPGAVDENVDNSIPFYSRTEVRCHKCQGHLGHVFEDGPAPTGLRYCMNGLALAFVPKDA